MHPQIFRKILDYLFRGKVPLSSIEDAWKVKVAGRMFELKELEDLCTKFLKYRLDSTNLLIYLKNATKYECPDLKEVIFQRFAKDAMQVLDDDELLNLQETDLLGLIQQEPDVQARKVIEVLIKWAKRRYGYVFRWAGLYDNLCLYFNCPFACWLHPSCISSSIV